MTNWESDVHLGHIYLGRSFDVSGEQFIVLVEALQKAGLEQHVLVRNEALAKRIGALTDVVVGPIARSAVTAYCLMPRRDLVHIHDMAAGQAGLLLTLTRSIPYVLSHSPDTVWQHPLTQAVFRRARCIVCSDDSEASIVRHYDPSLRIEIVAPIVYRRTAEEWLRLYQNSQRIPIAGNKGIQ
jgi:hypothetical protein